MIKVQNLRFKYAQAGGYALDGVTLQIKSGKYTAIVGHNGSGKSTLSKILVGLAPPTSGEVWVDDILLSRKNLKKIRSRIGMVFQNPENQFIGATVEDDIAFGLENKLLPRRVMHEKVRKYAQKVNMLDHLSKEPQNLSGGQKQRVAIAATLAIDPKIVVFDEVTSMLDPKGKREVLEIMEELKKDDGKTLIVVTHDMDEAVLADEIIVLAGGKVIAKGDPHAILSNQKIIKQAKIESPFIYRVATALGPEITAPTFSKTQLLGNLCK